ncbi:hypothetical protein HNP37_002565 [Flavobacterium nitrogenifigens]|uniref:Uncharacterized protein n=2 Tax=Flavobacterium TaxID=237 RepID=A0A7W7IXV1_9FLAO|nr:MULTISPECIES: hypothetical protein [Flavobacterium]MBB4802492.1 hypothetical protein [Flavobacterium nitrogenifigens]MBB6387450.1 hypothetical protein [Flavobacterium notoginsengisoli]
MSNHTNTELNEKFFNQEKEPHFPKPITSSIVDSIYLYGMSLEEYQEGMEIHSKCFDQLQNLAN